MSPEKAARIRDLLAFIQERAEIAIDDQPHFPQDLRALTSIREFALHARTQLERQEYP